MKIINPYRFAPTGPSVLVQDTFTDTNGTAITAHSPDIDVVGDGWVVDGTATVESNKYSSVTAVSFIDCGASEMVAEAEITFSSASGAQGMVIRAQDANNLWMASVSTAGAANPVLRIYERVAGTFTERAISTLTGEGPLSGETWVMTLTASGNVISVDIEINSNPYHLEYTSTLFNTSGGCGFRSSGHTGFVADNFSVTG